MSELWQDASSMLVASDLGDEAIYRPGGVGTGTTIRVVRGMREVPTDLGAVRAATQVARIDILPSAVASPARGDTIEIGSAVYEVAEQPRRDLEETVWTLYCFRRAS